MAGCRRSKRLRPPGVFNNLIRSVNPAAATILAPTGQLTHFAYQASVSDSTDQDFYRLIPLSWSPAQTMTGNTSHR